MTYAIEALDISKVFPKVVANDNITLQVEAGTIHAIVGENGAGKSTLMNILYGLYTPTKGTVKIKGEAVQLKTPKEAIQRGVGMVHQHFMLIPTMTVSENIVLGNETGSAFHFDGKKAVAVVEELSRKYRLEVNPRALVSDISVGMQQQVEILKALYQGVDILILDEPTAVLTPQEIEELFMNLKDLVAIGKTIIIITHKLDEVMNLSQRISVLRRGKMIGTVATAEVDEKKLTEMMVGREVHLGGEKRISMTDAPTVLQLEKVTLQHPSGHAPVKAVSLVVKAGEIIGIAGVEGNGQSEIVQMVAGVLSDFEGDILLEGVSIKKRTVREIREAGVGYIPEDRHRHGLVMDYTVRENLICGIHYRDPFARKKLLQEEVIRKFADGKIRDYDIRPTSMDLKASSLSGGNQQKIIIAREISQDPRLVLAAQPTRGLDVGAIEFVHDVLVSARNKGDGVLLVSLELDELFLLCDAIYVMYDGKVVGRVQKKDFNREEIGLMMLGLKDQNKERAHG